ncbi:hypothetical protein [Arthrobacter sp. Br18]|uniref:hypothetical protein n=1 Tax=Arthrobacter sp. Br18 TaxID=1312954 RepID=UPI0004B2A79D|nr:hypothetical protein [Arthrobacter sp. Br18]
MIAYLDTSAAPKLLVEERESLAVTQSLSGTPDLDIVASMLLYTELRCASRRRAAILASAVNTVLRGVISLMPRGQTSWSRRELSTPAVD